MDIPLQQAELEEKDSADHEFQINFGLEADSSNNTESFEATIDVHKKTATLAKTGKSVENEDPKNQELSEGERDRSSKLSQVIDTKEGLETGEVESENLVQDREKLRNEAESTGQVHPKDDANAFVNETYLGGKSVLEAGVDKLRKISKTGTNNEGFSENGETSKAGESTNTFTEQVPPVQNSDSRNGDQSETVGVQEMSPRFLILAFWRFYCERLRRNHVRLTERWKKSLCRKQLIEEPLFYAFGLVACLVCLTIAIVIDKDRDIPICILSVIIFCSAATLVCKRGCLVDYKRYKNNRSHIIREGNRLRAEFESVQLQRSSLFDCFLCSSQEYEVLPPRGHWYVKRKAEVEGNTDFQHEVVDVSNLKSNECPQIRRVGTEDLESTSSDASVPPDDFLYYRRHRRTRADVYSQENVGDAINSRGNSRRFDEDSRPEVNQPPIGFRYYCKKNVVLLEVILKPRITTAPQDDHGFICEHYGQGVACACAELHEKELAEGQKVKGTLPFRPAGNNSNTCSAPEDTFVCERHGPGAACGCPELTENRKMEDHASSSTSTEDACSNPMHGPGMSCKCFEKKRRRKIAPLCKVCGKRGLWCTCRDWSKKSSSSRRRTKVNPGDYQYPPWEVLRYESPSSSSSDSYIYCPHCNAAKEGQCPNLLKWLSASSHSSEEEFICRHCEKATDGTCSYYEYLEGRIQSSDQSESQ